MNGVERLKILSEEIKDKALLKIVDYLLSRTDMDEKYLNETKTLKQMVDYIKTEAKKQAKNGIAMIEDEVVYGWAIHYFDEPNEVIKIDSNVSTCSEIPNVEKVTKKQEKVNKKNWIPEGQLSLFD